MSAIVAFGGGPALPELAGGGQACRRGREVVRPDGQRWAKQRPRWGAAASG